MSTQTQQPFNPQQQQNDPKMGWQQDQKTIPGGDSSSMAISGPSSSAQQQPTQSMQPGVGIMQQQPQQIPQQQQPQSQRGYMMTQVTQTTLPQSAVPLIQTRQSKFVQLGPDDAVEYSSTMLQAETRDNDPAKSAQYHVGDTPPIINMRKQHKRLWGFGVACMRGGTLELNGPCVMPKNLNVFIFIHGATYDLSMAHFIHPVSCINLWVTFGGVNVQLPRGVRLESGHGCAILGNIAGLDEYSRADATQLNMQAPVVKITGITVLGGMRPEINKAVNPIVIVTHKSPAQFTQLPMT
jgi:hypothetical protein